MNSATRSDHAPANWATLAGTLIGTAVGDSLGLPMEGLSAGRQSRLFPGPLGHRLFGHFGMISDDTEHTLMVAQALLEHPDDVARFQRALAWKLRWWLLALPAGVGFATLRAILKLWAGISPDRSGVFSAGNGPAMRSALLGTFFVSDPEKRRDYVRASTRLTHTDPRAETGAQAVAEMAAWIVGTSPLESTLLETFRQLSSAPEWQDCLAALQTALTTRSSVREFASGLGLTNGISGYVFHTVPVAIYAALLHRDDFGAAVTEIIRCGGDTDTAAAITGGLVGARVGPEGIPLAWRTGVLEWPRSMRLIANLARHLSEQVQTSTPLGQVPYFWPAVPVRNLFFLLVVLGHGFRRLFPPY